MIFCKYKIAETGDCNVLTLLAGVFNAAIFPCVWIFFPEPKGRSLEELDVIFASAHSKKENPVKTAKHMPRLEGRELERELDRYFNEDGTAA